MINASFWKNKKVFLTGHTGFKGTWLSIWLNEMGAKVFGYALRPQTNPSLFDLTKIEDKIQSVIGDIKDISTLKKEMSKFQPDIVIHMAAQPLVKESYENPVSTYEVNVMGTVNIFESVRHCTSVKAIVNVTTDKVYENKEWLWGYRENDRLNGYDPYSNSKACSELVTSAYVNSFFNPVDYQEHGVAVATARAGNVIGGGDWANDRIVPDIVRAFESEKPILLRNPSAIRPWQHVLEPLSGYLILAEKLYSEGEVWNGAWNFGPDDKLLKSVETLVESFRGNFNEKLNIGLAKNNEFHETSILKLDSSKARNLLKWNNQLSFGDTVMFTTEWYKNYKAMDKYDLCVQQIKYFTEVGDSN